METALSTIEAKIIALAAPCRELLPIIDMVTSLLTSLAHLLMGETTINLSIHEETLGVLVWQRPYHCNSHLRVNNMPAKRFGFENKFTNVEVNF